MKSLFIRLSFAFTVILLILGVASLWLANRSSQNHILEFTQKLNRPIAMYMSENVDWLLDGQLNPQALDALAPHIMVINPSVEVYLLDAAGRVIWPQQSPAIQDRKDNHWLVSNIAPSHAVDLSLIRRFVDGDFAYPLLAPHPVRTGENTIFSTWPVYADVQISHKNKVASEPIGFVYVALASEKHQSMLASVKGSYALRDWLITLSCVLVLSLCSGVFIFFMLTRRLRVLAQNVRHAFQGSGAYAASAGETDQLNFSAGSMVTCGGDEIDLLKRTYESIHRQLLEQYQRLEQSDSGRREFVAGISHDLRTPLTSLQNYLETVLDRWSTMDANKRQLFITKAHRQTLRLRHLISQLFEISRLNAPDLKLQPETFSMLELAVDCVHDCDIDAGKKGISIKVNASIEDASIYQVHADIALLQRVLENLLGNAIRYTPMNGLIRVILTVSADQRLRVDIQDNGCGLSDRQIERFRQTGEIGGSLHRARKDSQYEPSSGGTGFGLAIVQRILKLHDSQLQLAEANVLKQGNDNVDVGLRSAGTSFYFFLPTIHSDAYLCSSAA